MLNTILQFQQTTEDFHLRLNEVEKKAKANYPNATSLLELCERLNNVRQKFADVSSRILIIQKAQENLQNSIEKYYIPSAKAVYNACNTSGRIRIDRFAVPQLKSPKISSHSTTSNIDTSNSDNKSTITAGKKKSSDIKNEKPSRKSHPEYLEITEEEFTAIDKRQRNGINLDTIRNFHKQIFDYFHQNDSPTKLLRNEMPKMGFNTKLDICIGVLKSLNRITLDRSRNIESCLN